MFIVGLGTSAPPRRFTQAECWEALCASGFLPTLSHRSQAILRKVLLGDNGIDSRHLAFESLQEAFKLSPDVLHERFSKHAPMLAREAAEAALVDAGLKPEDIDAVIISTCTGYLCPGLTSYVCETLGLRADVLPLDLVGQGCGAALPNLITAEALLNAGRARRVLTVCVEVCSAAFYLDDDPGVLISACLFGDGAGAAVSARDPLPGRRQVCWLNASSRLSPAERDLLRFDQKAGMLRNILTLQVPRLAGQFAESLLEQMLAQGHPRREQITGWILHAGGREILHAMKDRLQLAEEDLQWSADVLRRYGNVSSPCVLFVLKDALAGGQPDGIWWMSSFGAGFSCHGAFLEVHAPH
ncbi:MAG: 3-oxoacyl-[acyl-carrier-protein] synthase III C-terminal domain-containing protein [Verrucomicrobiota bacterium]